VPTDKSIEPYTMDNCVFDYSMGPDIDIPKDKAR